MQIITGRTGKPHVYAADDAEIYRVFLGDGDYVLTTGNQLNARQSGTVFGQIDIYDGSLITQGRLAKIRPSDGFDSIKIDAGTTGYKREDIIVAEYTKTEVEKDGEQDFVEAVTLKVVKGPVNANNYVEPSITTGNIDNGETHQVPLWAVFLDGNSIVGLESRRTILTTNPLNPLIDRINASVLQVNSTINTFEKDTEEVLRDATDEIESMISDMEARVAGYFRGEYTWSGSRSTFEITMPSGYAYKATDMVSIYVNGLRLRASEYTLTSVANDSTIKFTVSVPITGVQGTDYVEAVVIR